MSFNSLCLRYTLERFANEQWLPAHATPQQAAEIVVDQFRRTVKQTMEMLEVVATNGKRK